VTSMFFRTIVLALAWFACVNAIGTVLARSLASALRGRSASSRPWVLLAVRLLPASVSILFVGAMFLPAQWALEPRDTPETMGLALYAIAIVGAALLLRSARRIASVARAGDFVMSGARRHPCDRAHTYEVDTVPGVSLAGVVRPRILIGGDVTKQLSHDELDVAIAHEIAHRDAFDNLARWCMHCAPDFLFGSAVASQLEQAWHVAAESRADARAIGGNSTRAVHLASALIKVARLSAVHSDRVSVPAWSTLNDSELLEWRVHRLLSGPLPQSDACQGPGSLATTVAVCLLIAAPVLAESVHRLTETVVAFVP
jgi:beta-lactamase regulating signal transducer with metallopeptidase domain